MLSDRIWKTIDGEEVDDILAEFKAALGDGSEREVHVGSDSQQAREVTEFVTVLVVRTLGKGGRVFYSQEQAPRVKSLRERLMREVWLSVSVGLDLSPDVPIPADLTIHVDANPNVRFKSSAYIKELTAAVMGQGFKALLKPESWAATHLADHVVKRKVLGM